MKARAALRAGTATEHEAVDRLFTALDLARPEDYRLFLTAQATCFPPVEEALESAGVERFAADWQMRKRSHLLKQDLKALGVPLPAPEAVPALAGAAESLGALYVLEGSRLGGAMLKRSVSADMPQAFLSSPQPAGAWRKLLETLDHHLYETASIEAAVGAARRIFHCFEAGGRRFLES